MIDPAGRVCVITGASRGLGLGMAAAMRGWGVKVALCARTTPELAGALCASVDVTERDQVDAFAERVAAEVGPIDLWVNNAGVLEPIAFVRDLDPAALERHWAVNVGGVLHGSQTFLRHLGVTGRRGTLVTISSGAAQKPYPAWGAYCSAKAGAERLTEVIAAEEGERLRAYSVAPGVIDTAMQETIRGKTEEEFPLVEKFRALKAAEAFNTPPFVAEWLLRLAFDPEGVARDLGEAAVPVSFRIPSMPDGWAPALGAG